MELLFWIAVVIAFLFGTTYLLKRTGKTQSFLGMISLLKTTKFNSSLDGIAKHKKFLNFFADLGLVLGFGALAVDYRYGRGKSPVKRIAIFLLSCILLFVLIEALAAVFPMISVFFTNPFFSDYGLAMKLAFVFFGLGGFVLAALAAYALFVMQNLLIGKQVCPGVVPIIPGVQIPGVPFVAPLHAWISFLIILVMHEGMHGTLARKAKVRIKSTGLLLAGLLPLGAFVEMDDKQLAKKKEEDQLRVFSAGPSSNLYTSFVVPVILSLLLVFAINPVFGPWVQEVKRNSVDAVFVDGVDEKITLCGQEYENNAFGKLKQGMEIKKIGKYTIISGAGASTAVSYSLSENKDKPLKIELLDLNGSPVTETIEPNELGQISFRVREEMNPDYVIPENYRLYTTVSGTMSSFLMWFILLNFFLAISNFLPLLPLDGGRIANIILPGYFSFLGLGEKKTQKLVQRALRWIIGILVLVNALPLFINMVTAFA